MSKILKILAKVVGGLVLFYLVFGFIITPLVLTWAIPNQGSKLLNHPVHLKSATFNPLSFRLTLHGFEILGAQQQVMVGFDQLSVKLKVFDLFKRINHVQSIEIDGLNLNAVLLPGDIINLQELIPASAPASSKPTAAAVASNSKSAPLPKVMVDSIIIHQGRIHFIDQTIKPYFSNTLSALEVHIDHIATDPNVQTKVTVHAKLDKNGNISLHSLIKPLAQPLELDATFKLSDYALTVVTPYSDKYTGRELFSGKLDLQMDYRISNNKITASHKILIQRFAFGKNVPSKDAIHLPFNLAVALLQDPDGKIRISLPVTGDMNDPKFRYSHLLLKVVRNFFLGIVSKPFSFLASSLGVSESGTDELGSVHFSPGKIDLMASQHKKLLLLIKGLKQHPKLELEINGGYDPVIDWKTIEADTFAKAFANLRKISTRSDSKVCQDLYQERYGIRALWALSHKYKRGIGDYDDQKLEAEIKRQMIENSKPDIKTLETLANTRAKIVYDFFKSNGFNAKRLSITHPQPVQASQGYVPLEFTMTVFDK